MIDEAEVIYWGRCPDCAAAAAAVTAGHREHRDQQSHDHDSTSRRASDVS